MKTNTILAVVLALVSAHAVGQGEIKAPQQPLLGTYVTDTGPSLKTGCTFRSGGPLLIDVPVPFVVNPAEVNANGYLIDPEKLIKNNVIKRQVMVTFPAYDVDDLATYSGIAPEIDTITFNGKTYAPGRMKGINNQWVMQTIQLDVKELKFGPNANQLRIDIDTGNVGVTEAWCTAVDWVSVKIDVAAPYVLAHGIASDSTTWNEANAPGVLAYLNSLGVRHPFECGTPFECTKNSPFSVTRNGSVISNGKELGDAIWTWLQTMKADRVNIIAHSKGGLDAQAMAANNKKFMVLSLSTLSTPHMGSVLADLGVLELEKVKHYDSIENSGADPRRMVNAYLNDFWMARFYDDSPKEPGLDDLQTSAYQPAVTQNFRGAGTGIAHMYSIGGNANLNNNADIDGNEANGMGVGGSESLWNPAWHVLREYSSAQAIQCKVTPGVVWGTNSTLVFSATTVSTPQENDLAVSVNSAHPDYSESLGVDVGVGIGNVNANHTTIKSAANVKTIIDKTITLR